MTTGIVGPRVDYERRVFICRDGVEFTLRPIHKLVLERLYNDQSGRPKIPIVEVEIAGQYKRKEANPTDPDYVAAVGRWNSQRNTKILAFIINEGIANDPPEDRAEYFAQFTINNNPVTIKYLWVVSSLGTEGEDSEFLTEAIVSQTAVTGKGLETAEEQFPGDSERISAGNILPGQASSEPPVLTELRGRSSESNDGSELGDLSGATRITTVGDEYSL